MEQSREAPQVDWADIAALFPNAAYPDARAVALVDNTEYSAVVTYLVTRQP